jgi:dTDP-4-amino-4,6-dideoxygalactose transaminase
MIPVVPFADLPSQYRGLKPEMDLAIQRVLESGQFILGPEVEAFEREFAEYIGVRHGVATNSGTSALHLALLATGAGPGDEVVTVSMTFIATAAAIRYTGATPVFVDIDPSSYTMSPDRLEAAITPRTRAIVPVHLYGQMADMRAIDAIAARHGLPIIEDAAQAHGARDADGRRAGGIGRAGCFSFYPAKNLGACGEGGMLVTSDDEIASRARLLRDWAQARRYDHVALGYNYRMDGLQGAILRVKLRHLDDWTSARQAVADQYDARLVDAGVTTPARRAGCRHVFHVYAIRSEGRDALRQHLEGSGVATGIHYPVPVHLQPAFADLSHRRGDFPVTERLADEVLSLPIYPELQPADLDHVATSVRAFSDVRAR